MKSLHMLAGDLSLVRCLYIDRHTKYSVMTLCVGRCARMTESASGVGTGDADEFVILTETPEPKPLLSVSEPGGLPQLQRTLLECLGDGMESASGNTTGSGDWSAAAAEDNSERPPDEARVTGPLPGSASPKPESTEQQQGAYIFISISPSLSDSL